MAARASSAIACCIFRNLRIFAATLALLVATVGAGELRAQALPKTPADFAGHLAALAGLDKLKLGPVTVHANWAETKTTLRGEAISLIVFKQSGVSKPYIAVVRFWHFSGSIDDHRDELAALMERGTHALAVMDGHLAERDWFVGNHYSIADIALYAYTHVAQEGGYDLIGYPAVCAWIERVAKQPDHVRIDQRVGVPVDLH